MSENNQISVTSTPSAPTTNSETLVGRMARSLNVDSKKLWATLNATCFKVGQHEEPFTQEQIMLVLIIAEQLGLNPLKREIFAFKKSGSVTPILSIDGWKQITLRNKNFNGYKIVYAEKMIDLPNALCPVPEWAECTMYVKDRDYPTVERVYAREVYVHSSPVWQKSPTTMLHHRAFIRAARFTFPISGVGEAEEDAMPVITTNEPVQAQQVAKKPVKTVVFNNQQKLTQWVDKAVMGCQKLGNWQNAVDCVTQQFGNPEEREYALNRLQEARSDFERSSIDVQPLDEVTSDTEEVASA